MEEAFYKQRGLFRGRAYCPDCSLVNQRNQVLLTYLAMPVVGGLLYWIGPFTWLGMFFLRLSLTFVIIIPLLVLHELSHMLVAQFMKFKVFGIQIGVGRLLLRFSVRGLPWELRALPIGGFTIVGSGPTDYYRLKLFFIFAAGPFIHLILGLASIWWFQKNYLSIIFIPIMYEMVSAFILANVIIFLSNIWPHRAKNLPGAPGTDGWHLFRMPFVKDSEIKEKQAGFFALEALQSYRANDGQQAREYVEKALDTHPNSLVALNMLGMVRMQVEDFSGSRETFLELLNKPDLPRVYRYIALNNVAYANILLEDASLLPEADEFSKEAYNHMPWVPAIVGTRGTVLAAMGHYVDGIDLLKKAMAAQTEKQDIAADSYHLAIAEASRGNLEIARSHYDLACKLDDKIYLKKKTEKVLGMA